MCTPYEIAAEGEQANEIVSGINALIACDDRKNITALATFAIGPQACLLTREHNLKAVTGATENVPDVKLAALDLAGGKECQQGGVQTGKECCANRFTLGLAIDRDRCRIRVEVQRVCDGFVSH